MRGAGQVGEQENVGRLDRGGKEKGFAFWEENEKRVLWWRW